MPVTGLYIYSEPRCASVDHAEVHTYIKGLVPTVRTRLRGAFLEDNGIMADRDRAGELARSLAAAKVKDPGMPVPESQVVLPGEAAYELNRLTDRGKAVYGILYDAYLLAQIFSRLVPPAESGPEWLHVVLTNQLIGTWDPADRRYHARTVLCGPVSIVSLSGITVAPAKDPGFYIARQGAEAFGLSEEGKNELAYSFAGDFISLDDGRLTEVVKGYVAQAVAYSLSGEAFCEDPDCRLFNAHWQREMIRAQLGECGGFCRRHAAMFNYQAMGDQG